MYLIHKGTVMSMKRGIFGFFLIFVLFIFSFTACTGSLDEQKAKTVATNLLARFYTVDSKATDLYDTAGTNPEKAEKAIDQIHLKFKDLLTKSEYEDFIRNRTYLDYVKKYDGQDVTISSRSSELIPISDEAEAIQYDFKATMKISDGDSTSIQKEEGIITVAVENNCWKVDSLKILTHLHFFQDSD